MLGFSERRLSPSQRGARLGSRVTVLLDDAPELVGSDAKFLRPELHLIILVQIDAGRVLRRAFAQVVRDQAVPFMDYDLQPGWTGDGSRRKRAIDDRHTPNRRKDRGNHKSGKDPIRS